MKIYDKDRCQVGVYKLLSKSTDFKVDLKEQFDPRFDHEFELANNIFTKLAQTYVIMYMLVYKNRH